MQAADAVARIIHDLRVKTGLSEDAFAKRIGTTAPVVSRTEDAEAEELSLVLLNRVAAAFNQRIEISFVPLQEPVLSR